MGGEKERWPGQRMRVGRTFEILLCASHTREHRRACHKQIPVWRQGDDCHEQLESDNKKTVDLVECTHRLLVVRAGVVQHAAATILLFGHLGERGIDEDEDLAHRQPQ